MKPRQPRHQPRHKPRHNLLMHNKNHANHAITRTHVCADAREKCTDTHIVSRTRVSRGLRGLSGFNELHNFKRGFWRGFYESGVVFSKDAV
jgi:hypothetical protein